MNKRKTLMLSDGFTIVEALISIIILTIVLAGGASLYFSSDKIVAMSTRKNKAAECANARMEELRAMSYADFSAVYALANPAVPETFTDANPCDEYSDIPFERTITVAYVPPVAGPDYKEVAVRVWADLEQAEQSTVELKSIIAP